MGESELKELLRQRDVLLEKAEELKKKAAELMAKIENKCAKVFEEKRGKTGKEYGAVTETIEGYQVKQTVGKAVTWDQEKLEGIAQRITATGDDPNEWMVKTWNVKEKEFKEWRPEIKAVFDPARTVKPKKPAYEFKEVQTDATT